MSYESASPLGKKVAFAQNYDASLLFPIPREETRKNFKLEALPFHGRDLWYAYEFSWLNLKGKPENAILEFSFPSSSKYLIESKSFKLYLNSFYQTRFDGTLEIEKILKRDLEEATSAQVDIRFLSKIDFQEPNGECIDQEDVTIDSYEYNPNYLIALEKEVEESLFSHLLRSTCPVTGQPDWATVHFKYRGKEIDRKALLQYVISFRDHREFHELCVERMFIDIMRKCAPKKLSVYARYTRRGGLDINPFRSNFEMQPGSWRCYRQ